MIGMTKNFPIRNTRRWDNMPTNEKEINCYLFDQLTILDDLQEVAEKENATETYEGLKNDYISLKAILTSLGVNLTDIDKIKE